MESEFALSDGAESASGVGEDAAVPSTESGVVSARARVRHLRVRSAALTVLAVVAVLFVSHLARAIVVPVLMALFFNLLFSPLVEWLSRRRVPRFVSALVLVLTLPAALIWGFVSLSEPASNWMAEAPAAVREVRYKLLPVHEQIKEVQQAAEAVDDLTKLPVEEPEVAVREDGMFEKLVQAIPTLLTSLAIMIFSAFFFLNSGRSFLAKLASLGRTFRERRQIVQSVVHVQRDVVRYLMTVSVINACLGLATGAWVALFGGDDALLWGVAAATANFAPYAGPLAVGIGLVIAGLITFPDVISALTLAGGYLFLTTIEGQLITPSVLGRNLSMSPVVVFLSVIVGAWLWGIPGALIAVPCLVSIKAVCRELEPLRPVARLLER